MPSPVVPDEFKELIPSSTSGACERFVNALILFPLRFWQFINWFLDSSGNVSEAAIKTITPTGGLFFSASPNAPTGYLLCDGAAVSRTTYDDLFTEIGTTWGAGDGSTTFNVPDFRARFPVGVGSTTDGTYALADVGGAKDVVLAADHIGPHIHPFWTVGGTGGVQVYAEKSKRGTNFDPFAAGSGAEFAETLENRPNGPGATPSSDTDAPDPADAHENRPPFAACYIYIKD